MKKLLKLTLAASVLMFGQSCTDLEENLEGDFTEIFTPGNPQAQAGGGSNDGLTAAYSRLLNGSANHGSYFSMTEVSTDEAVITQKGGDWFDGGVWLDIHKHDFQATNPQFNGPWNDTFGGIAQSNILLGTNLSASDRAKVRTLRAYFYWRLLDNYGRVRIITETTGGDVPQATRAAVFAFVEKELLESIPDLAGGREYARATQGGAYALLARLYLNAQVYTGTARYQDAINAADMVINSGVYNLSPNYADVFSPTNTDNVEHIWAIPYDEATGTGMNFAQMTLHYPSQLSFRLQQQPWNGYSTLEDFYNSYADGDTRKANNFLVGPQLDVNGSPILDLAFDPADPDGAAIVYTPAINELAPNGSRQAGARLGKFSFKLGQLPDMDNDFPILRYGEVLLNKAEAASRLAGGGTIQANNATALALVNQIRTRAGVPALSSLPADVFLAERGRELFQESLRRTDLIRFGQWGRAWWEKPAHSNPNLNLFPIPLEQIQASQADVNKLTQNPGY
jgi:hypothetical protein